MSTWWLSFCDPDLPAGSQFLGCCVIGGATIIEAVKNAHVFDCNPGGEVMGAPIPDDLVALIDESWKRRLLTRAECEAFDAELRARRKGPDDERTDEPHPP